MLAKRIILFLTYMDGILFRTKNLMLTIGIPIVLFRILMQMKL